MSETKHGIHCLDYSKESVRKIRAAVEKFSNPSDIVILSIHWGPNWSYHLEPYQRSFAHKLIDDANVDIIYGHSSHHIKGMELYKGKLILYGTGDFLSDYEGYGVDNKYRKDLRFMYFVDVETGTGNLSNISLVPLINKKLQVVKTEKKDSAWLLKVTRRECAKFGSWDIIENRYYFTGEIK